MKFIDKKLIPSIGRGVVSFDYYEDKASRGSYKAPDMLLELLEFAAVAIVGPNAFDEKEVEYVQEKLAEAYKNQFYPDCNGQELIAYAIKWAWAPMDNGVIVFDYLELMKATKALCQLIEVQPDELVVKNLVEHHIHDNPDWEDFRYLGGDLRQLDIPRLCLVGILEQFNPEKAKSILCGFDEFSQP